MRKSKLKPLFALIGVLAATLLLTSCGLMSTLSDDFATPRSDKSVDYTALNVDLISVLVNDARIFELQIGMEDGALSASESNVSTLKTLGSRIGSALGASTEYLGSYGITCSSDFYMTQTDYTYFVYRLNVASGIMLTEQKFGFFEYSYDYTISNPSAVNSACVAVMAELSSDILEPGHRVDYTAVQMRYFLDIDSKFKAENATRMTKIVLSADAEERSCLVWRGDENTDFTTLGIKIKVMAPGWYIVPILLGTMVAAILMMCGGNNSKSVFRPSSNDDVFGSDITGDNPSDKSVTDDVFYVETDEPFAEIKSDSDEKPSDDDNVK